MTLTIEDPELDRLVQRLATLTGETPEVAVREALREMLEREERAASRVIRRERGSLDEVLAIATRISSRPIIDRTPPEEMLYDEHGLPR